MDFKVGLSANPNKDMAVAKVASEAEKNLKDALKEVLDEIGMCMENARLIDQRVKEMAGQAAFEIEKKLAENGTPRVTRLARALGFDIELDEDEPDDDEALASLPDADTEDSAEDAGGDDDDSDFNFDDDGDNEDDGDSDFSFDDDEEDEDASDFSFDEDDDDEEFKFD